MVKGEWPAFVGRFWQRNYYEHIVRDEQDLARIQEYVAGNPACWHEDAENPANVKARLSPPPDDA